MIGIDARQRFVGVVVKECTVMTLCRSSVEEKKARSSLLPVAIENDMMDM
jgi:hypothetical protein